MKDIDTIIEQDLLKSHSIREGGRMTNTEKIMEHLRKSLNGKYCDDCLSGRLGILPRQQVNQICNKLFEKGRINRQEANCSTCLTYKITNHHRVANANGSFIRKPKIPIVAKTPTEMNWKEFENLARQKMSDFFKVQLWERQPQGCPKRFDMVSHDESIVGDAKFLTLVNRISLPPAKFMEIAGHVWLLERLPVANRRFLVFGNQRRVPEWWLEKYGSLVQSVEFYFIDKMGVLEKLN